jgi:hypothetical protein
MTRLIITADSSSAGAIQRAGPADLVIAVERRLVWGPLPSVAELEAFFGPRSGQPHGLHWLDDTPSWRLDEWGIGARGLTELIADCDSVQLWMGAAPNAQLLLIWLLDHCRREAATLSRLGICEMDEAPGGLEPETLATLDPAIVTVTPRHSDVAERAWRAYRAPTPQAWWDLLKSDLKPVPKLGSVIVELLDELPDRATGLCATERRMLELIAPGGVPPFDVFPGQQKPTAPRVFDYWEVGALLDGLARCPLPAMSGLEEGPFSLDMHNDPVRHARYKQSRLSLTDLGTALLAGEEDFHRHNPSHRWWGGTELTNERLWRWDPQGRALIAP